MSDQPQDRSRGDRQTDSGIKRFVTDSMVVAYLTASAYIVAFSYCQGYAGAFKVPRNLITIDLVDILVAFAAIAGVALLWLMVVDQVVGTILVLPRYLARKVTVVLMSAALAGTVFWSDPSAPIVGSWLLIALVVGVALLEFVLPLLTRRDVKGYLAKLEAQAKNVSSDPTMLRWFAAKAPDVYVAVLFAFGLAWFAALYGHGAAIRQETFLVQEGSPRLVVLVASRDRMILAPLTADGRNVQASFRVVALPAGPDAQFTLTKTGKLGVVEP